MRPTSIRLSDPATDKLAALTELYGSQTKALEIAIDRLYTMEVTPMNAREFVGHNQTIIGGPASDEELTAARAIGAINAYQRPLFDALTECKANLPDGWMLSPGDSTHQYHLPAPAIPAAATEPILMGFVLVIHGDPHYPVWLWKRKDA